MGLVDYIIYFINLIPMMILARLIVLLSKEGSSHTNYPGLVMKNKNPGLFQGPVIGISPL